jgi:hypothetical protein
MDEGDLEAEHAAPRSLVDQLSASLREVRERGAEVLDLVRDMVHARAAFREETAHRSVVVECAEQLQAALAHPDRRRLDTLLLDTRAMLEARSEQAPVRVERAVEILDGETDVMHRAGRLPGLVHRAIVCERLAATMRVSALVIVLTAAFLSGCGGHGKSARPNGEASKPAARVLADAKAAATSARSAHVAGRIAAVGMAITLDLDMVRGKGAKGSMSTNGLQFDLVRIGDTAYIHGSDEFYTHFAGASIAQLIDGKWIKASILQGRLGPLAPLTSMSLLFATIGASHGKLVSAGKTTYKGRSVVAIRDPRDKSRLYVAATGNPYPVALVGGRKDESGTIAFGNWNESVSLSAPKDALDIARLGG